MPAPLEPRYTLKDVADRAGVAISTASLVFRGKRPVAEPTRERVLEAAVDLDYGGPNPLASSLRQGRSGIICVFAEGRLMNSFSDPFAVSILDGLAQHLGQNSAGILLMPAQGAGQDELVRRTAGIPLDAVVFPLGGYVSSAPRASASPSHPARGHRLPRGRRRPAPPHGRARSRSGDRAAPLRPRAS